MNLQEQFLDEYTNKKVTMFLTNGVKLKGTIEAHDDNNVALTRDDVTQLVYKHSIATIMPGVGSDNGNS